MAGNNPSRRRARGIDPALIQLCRAMKPVERLEAAVKLAEVTLQFHRAGVEFRQSVRDRGRSLAGQGS